MAYNFEPTAYTSLYPEQEQLNPAFSVGGQPTSAYNPVARGSYSARLTPEEVAQLQLKDRVTLEIERKKQQGKETFDKLRQSKTAQSLKGRAGMIGAGTAGLGIAATQLLGGEPLGAVAGLGGSVAGGKLGSSIGGVFGVHGRLIGGALGSVAGGLIFGQGAEYAKAAVTGAGKGKEAGGTEPPAYIPGTNIPLNETARYLESQKAIGNQQLDLYKGYSAADRAGMKDIIQHSMETQVQLSKRLDPIIQQSKDKDMVRTQALLNTQGNIDARLGILATQGALAKGAQAEAGALARTMAGTNPYIQAAVRQSPNIQFG